MDKTIESSSISWRETFYEHLTSKDGQRRWRQSHTRHAAYKAPGLYRETTFDEHGEIQGVTIRDASSHRELSLDFTTRRAVLVELATPRCAPGGPFAGFKESLRAPNLQWIETRETAAGPVNVFRHAFRDQANGCDWSYDFWIDQRTKRLVSLRVPGADIYDPENDPLRGNPPEAEWSYLSVAGAVQDAINFDPDLDDSLFRLEPPEHFTVERQRLPPQVTEGQMIEYLGVLAEFNDKSFPDQVFPFPFASELLNRVWDKPKEQRTAAEQKLLDVDHQFMRIGRGMPIVHFLRDSTERGSFQYLGKGVRLGDRGRIVCWYKLKGATTYRMVCGDLAVKDARAEDLPLPVES